jgi:hypothetical protein
MTPDLARRRSLLTAALGFVLLRKHDGSAPPETETLRKWLDNWQGVGHVVTGMNRQGYMLNLSNVDASIWRATFSQNEMLSPDGFGADATQWKAVQLAPRNALGKRRGDAQVATPAEEASLP